MNLKKMTRDEIEKLSHLDIAYYIIKNSNKKYGTIDLLKKVCELLEYEENAFENLIGEFYTSLNLDKRFILIDGNWDLTENHSVKIVVEDEVDDDLDTYEDMDEEEGEIEDEAVLDDTEALEDVEDDLDDEMEDLTILTEEELEEEEN
jgi:DNA-directed RNA polymerase subunit delta